MSYYALLAAIMTQVDIYLCGFSAHPFEGPVDGLQRVFGLPRPKAEGLLASLPQYVLVDLDRDEAKPWVEALRAFGGQVEVHPHEEEHVAEVAVTQPTPIAMSPRPQLANPTVSLSAPPRASSQRFIGSVPASDASATTPSPAAGVASVPAPKLPQPQLSPSGRIVGSVRPPTRISAPASKPPDPADGNDGPIRPSTIPPVFEDALHGQPRTPPPSKTPPGQLWAPTPVYQSNPPTPPFTILIPVRAVMLVGGVAALIWMAYRFASP